MGGGEPPAAGAAEPHRDPGCRGAVPPAAAGAAPRALPLGPIGLRGISQRAHAYPLATAHLVDGLSEHQELVVSKVRHERPEVARSSHMNLPHPPQRPPGGIVAKQRSRCALGLIQNEVGECMAFGGSGPPNHHLLSEQLD